MEKLLSSGYPLYHSIQRRSFLVNRLTCSLRHDRSWQISDDRLERESPTRKNTCKAQRMQQTNSFLLDTGCMLTLRLAFLWQT